MIDLSAKIGIPALIEQCAEECVELSKACLKMSRKMRNENPTPLSENDILQNLAEEMADVTICMNAIVESGLLPYESIDSEIVRKEELLEKDLIKKRRYLL